jgi:hypothetical protein
MRRYPHPPPLEQRVVVVRVEAHPKHADRCLATAADGSRGDMTLAALGENYRLADDCELLGWDG